MLVKVARLGTAVQEVVLTDSATVADALSAADLTVENEEIRVNNNAASVSSAVRNGDIVTLVPKVKGGQRIIKVARLGTAVREVAVDTEATVADALDAADITVENEDIRLDGRSVTPDTRVGGSTLITIVPKVKGGKNS